MSLSLDRTGAAMTRFLHSPQRRTCAFVNPSDDELMRLSRAATIHSLQITHSEECDVGSVVRLLRRPQAHPYPVMPSPTTPSPLRASSEPSLRRDVSFHTQAVVNQVRRVVSGSNERPELTEDGTGGVYMIRESESSWEFTEVSDVSSASSIGAPVAVFKPSDEEAGSENNPRGLVGSEHVMRDGFVPGEGATRERVAYKLDRGFAGVPRTAVDKLLLRSSSGRHLREQSGSIQEYVESEGDASDFRFDGSEFEVAQSQHIALQDCRLFNCDRHEGNILVRPRRDGSPTRAACGMPSARSVDERRALVPIDHAFCLPRFGFFREAEFAWRYWVSAHLPFTGEAREYVRAIDVEADVRIARGSGLDESSCATLRVCTMLVQHVLLGDHGSEATPHTLGMLLMREPFDVPSPFERMCSRALGLSEERLAMDTGLISFITEQQAMREQPVLDYVPPPNFYETFAALLEDTYGPLAEL